MLHLVQLSHPIHGRRVAVVDEPNLRLVSQFTSVYDAAVAAIRAGQKLEQLLGHQRTNEPLDYGAIYDGRSDWKLLAPFDHPRESSRCFVTGTGLTHKASAENRQSMHGAPTPAPASETDSMKMYR